LGIIKLSLQTIIQMLLVSQVFLLAYPIEAA
jgi:hypothetical protein